MKNKIIVIFSSHLGNEENNKFIKHIHDTIGIKHEIYCYENYNQYSLSEIYNKAIDEHYTKDSIIVLIHNDLIIKTNQWGKILLKHFNNSDYGIIGLAGTTYLDKDSGVWWSDKSKMVGQVSHTNGISEWVSEYSNPIKGIQPVVNVDGVFIAVDCDKIVHKFDENYGKFHFYDLSFSVKNFLQNVNVGVISDIHILHKSVGRTNEEWELNRQKFAEEYKDELPIRYVPENGKLRILICCQFFCNYTGSEMSVFETAKELVKMGNEVTIISVVVGEPLLSKAKKCGIDVYSINNPPNFILNENKEFQFIKNEKEFDIIHINHKPIGDLVLQLYINTPAVMHVRSEVIPVYEEPIIHLNILRYISIRESITEYIKSFGIEEEKIVLIDNPFDVNRFNTNNNISLYKQGKNPKEIVLFIGTLDHLRKNILHDLNSMTFENNQELWIIGADNNDYVKEFTSKSHIKYLGIKSNVEEFIKKCDYTAGIFKGRTTIEGFLCGKSGWIYTVDKQGNILNKELQKVPTDLEKYYSSFSTKKLFNLYNEIIDEKWL
jgi:glycosyltransferase involved in cell wall biosynthesis